MPLGSRGSHPNWRSAATSQPKSISSARAAACGVEAGKETLQLAPPRARTRARDGPVARPYGRRPPRGSCRGQSPSRGRRSGRGRVPRRAPRGFRRTTIARVAMGSRAAVRQDASDRDQDEGSRRTGEHGDEPGAVPSSRLSSLPRPATSSSPSGGISMGRLPQAARWQPWPRYAVRRQRDRTRGARRAISTTASPARAERQARTAEVDRRPRSHGDRGRGDMAIMVRRWRPSLASFRDPRDARVCHAERVPGEGFQRFRSGVPSSACTAAYFRRQWRLVHLAPLPAWTGRPGWLDTRRAASGAGGWNSSTSLDALRRPPRSRELAPLIITKCREVSTRKVPRSCSSIRAGELYFPTSPRSARSGRAPPRLRFPAEQGIAGEVLRTARASAWTTPRATRASTRRSTGHGFTTRSLLSPRSRRGRDHRVISREPPWRTFDDDDLAFLEALAGGVAVAIENAQLYARVRAAQEDCSPRWARSAATSSAEVSRRWSGVGRGWRRSSPHGERRRLAHRVLVEGTPAPGRARGAGHPRGGARAPAPVLAINCAALPERSSRASSSATAGGVHGATRDQRGSSRPRRGRSSSTR